MRVPSFALALCVTTLSFPAFANPIVVVETNMGNIEIEVDEKKAPQSAANFLKYVDDGYYSGTIFHRVIRSFMIQGGGFDQRYAKKKTRGPIKNEADNGLNNKVGTVAMARTNVVDSATSQFFINTKDNQFLNHRSKDARGYGYAVFGRVVAGMNVVQAIELSPTGQCPGLRKDCPLKQVVIQKAYRKTKATKGAKAAAPSGGGW